MNHNFLIVSIRNLWRNKTFSLINILGLATGMAAVLIIFLWVMDEISFDQYHEKKDQVALAYLMMTAGDDEAWENPNLQPTTSPAIAGELVSTYPEVITAARAYPLVQIIFKKENQPVIENRGLATEPELFDILTIHFLQGDPASALSEPYNMVLTKSMAEKYFGQENPVGQSLKINDKDVFTVSAVIEDMPLNASRRYDYLVPFTYAGELGHDISSTEMFYPCSYFTYTLLQPGTSLDTINAKLSRHIYFNGKNARGKISFVNLQNVYLTETGGTTRIYIFAMVAVVILLIACINYTNLSVAGAVGRLREIFTRKVNGAERRQLIHQFFTESFLISLLALVIAIGIIYLFLPHFNQLTGKTIHFSLFDIPTLVASIILLVLTSIAAGLYPALMLSNIRMGSTNALMPKLNGGKQHFQKILLFVQLSLTVVFIISSIVIYRQSMHVQHLDMGLNKHNVLYAHLGGTIMHNIPMLKEELSKHPDIEIVSSGDHFPNAIREGSYFIWGFPDRPATRMVYTEADYDYLKTFDIEMARGRFFSPRFPSDSSEAIVVNEAAMKALGKNIPTDSLFYIGSKNRNLIGVVKDFRHNSPLRMDVEPMLISLKNNNNTFVFIKLNQAIDDDDRLTSVKQFLDQTANRLSPDYPIEFRYLDTFTFAVDQSLRSWQQLILYSSLLSIIITCMGLLALIFLHTTQRTREIGIYKVNGARISDIMIKFYRSYLFWTLLANLIAWPLAWYLMDEFLKGFANRTSISWWIFPLAALVSIALLLGTTSWHVFQVSRRNPSEALRYE